MKKKVMIGVVGLVFTGFFASAQVVSRDSIGMLKAQKEAIAVSKKINEDKIKLAKLENQVAEKTEKVKLTAEKAQISANENEIAARNLSDDAQNDAMAGTAGKRAKEAERNARNARKAVSDLDKLNKEIQEIKLQISQNESKLNPEAQH